jgi:hypothetical protein
MNIKYSDNMTPEEEEQYYEQTEIALDQKLIDDISIYTSRSSR